jgi:cytochrome c553
LRDRLKAALAASLLTASPAAAADPASGREAAESCAACHGENGVSTMPGVPSLAGQPDGFIQWQLVYYRSGRRRHEAMTPIAEALSDAEIRGIGAYFAALPPPPPPPGPDPRPDLTEAGAKIARQHRCGACHKDDFTGQQATARLAGQREDALLKALRDFKAGARTGAGVAAMPDAVAPLADGDLVALAHYLSRLR